MGWQRPWLMGMLLVMLAGVYGCRTTPIRRDILSDREVPILLKKGETVVVPWDGYLMEAGTLFDCERYCLQQAIGTE